MNVRVIPASATTDRLLGILAEIKKVDVGSFSLSLDDDFLTILNIDSLDAVQLTMRIASEFGFNFGEDIDDINALSSVGALAALIDARTQGGHL